MKLRRFALIASAAMWCSALAASPPKRGTYIMGHVEHLTSQISRSKADIELWLTLDEPKTLRGTSLIVLLDGKSVTELGNRLRIGTGHIVVLAVGVFNFRFARDVPVRDYHSWSSAWKPRGVTGSATIGSGVPVMLWFDSARHRLEKSIRVDVVDGRPQTSGDKRPILDLVSYVNARVLPGQPNYVIVTFANHERFADVFRVVDACRQTRATAIVVNSLHYEDWGNF